MRVATTAYERTYTYEPAVEVEAVRAALARAGRFTCNVLLFAAAPFIGLAYVLAAPFVGLAALAWIGTRAALERRGA